MDHDLLVAAPSRWDEATFAMPAVRAAVAYGLGTAVVCRSEQAGLWSSISQLRVISYSGGESARQLAGKLDENWQLSIAWENGVAAQAFKLAKVQRRLGTLQLKWRSPFTNVPDLSIGPLDHRVQYYLAMFESLGIPTKNPAFYQNQKNNEPARKVWLLAPDSDFGKNHQWPLDRWVEIANRLLDRGEKLHVVSWHSSKTQAQQLIAGIPGRGEATTILLDHGVLDAFADFSFLLSADSSLSHLASCAGLRCAVLFGPNDPQWKRPLGRQHVIIRQHVECAPCLMAKCPMDLRCQSELSVDHVWTALQPMLDSV
ncbi:MAG: lipopolysaccharide heptosyltransferase family protein [Verrucomicrobia bacterium]|nr:MAG: lipopolysaccharide heptosyltransferase family protein [Verrucomicrobiota bacterium]